MTSGGCIGHYISRIYFVNFLVNIKMESKML